jgi:large subunit ribosomal protein L11
VATKRISQVVTLQLDAGNAGMVDIGKMLGPSGVNTRALKSEYDEATASQRGEVAPVVVTVYEDRSYTLRYKTPPTSHLIRRTLGLASGSPDPGTQPVGMLTRDQPHDIALRSYRTSTPATSRWRCGRSRAPPARWAYGWRTDVGEALSIYSRKPRPVSGTRPVSRN